MTRPSSDPERPEDRAAYLRWTTVQTALWGPEEHFIDVFDEDTGGFRGRVPPVRVTDSDVDQALVRIARLVATALERDPAAFELLAGGGRYVADDDEPPWMRQTSLTLDRDCKDIAVTLRSQDNSERMALVTIPVATLRQRDPAPGDD